jgi:glycosyltransferase involved in cell wall biosynthesis
MTPKVTICIPAYNHGRYVGNALESALAQTMRDIEVVVSDDSSTDATYEVARRSQIPAGSGSTERRQPGMVENWNLCLRNARGEYVKLLCSDDILEPSCLEKQAIVLDTHEKVVLVSAARRLLDEEGAETGVAYYADRFVVKPGTDVINDCFHRVGNLIGEPCAVLFRRAAASRGFHTAYRQLTDLEMWFHLLERGGFAHVPEALCGLRRHAGQQTWANAESLAFADDEFRLFDDFSEAYISFRTCRSRVRYNKALLVWNRGLGCPRRFEGRSQALPPPLFRLVTLWRRLLGAGDGCDNRHPDATYCGRGLESRSRPLGQSCGDWTPWSGRRSTDGTTGPFDARESHPGESAPRAGQNVGPRGSLASLRVDRGLRHVLRPGRRPLPGKVMVPLLHPGDGGAARQGHADPGIHGHGGGGRARNVVAESFWGYSHLDPGATSLNRLLLVNVAAGCTMILNRSLLRLALPFPPEAVMHDYWCILVASSIGKVSYRTEGTVMYRQHPQSCLGARSITPVKPLDLLWMLLGLPARLLAGSRTWRRGLRRTGGRPWLSSRDTASEWSGKRGRSSRISCAWGIAGASGAWG